MYVDMGGDLLWREKALPLLGLYLCPQLLMLDIPHAVHGISTRTPTLQSPEGGGEAGGGGGGAG